MTTGSNKSSWCGTLPAVGESILLFTVLSYVLSIGNAIAYDETVHPLINEMVHNDSRLPVYFDTQLKIDLTQTDFGGQRAWRHMADGGTAEDNGMRAWNHFHDPLRLWDHAGYGGGRSNAMWAQDQTD